MFKEEHVNKIIENQIPDNSLVGVLMNRFNAVLAGGVAYALSKNSTIKKHLEYNESSDIDLYFRNSKDYNQAVNYIQVEIMKGNPVFRAVHAEKSITGLCYNVYVDDDSNSISSYKMQLVGCLFGTPEEIVTSFDFSNLEVCYYLKGGEYVKLSSNNVNNDLIDIRHTRSPFLMHRIYKYIKYRGLVGVTENSRQHITDWLIKAASGYYEENRDGCPSIYVDILNNYPFKELMKNKDVIADADLSIVVGKIKEDVVIEDKDERIWHRGYSKQIFKKAGSIDLAIEQIKERSKHANKKEVC